MRREEVVIELESATMKEWQLYTTLEESESGTHLLRMRRGRPIEPLAMSTSQVLATITP